MVSPFRTERTCGRKPAPAWLQRRLTAHHLTYRVVNAGVSGDRVADTPTKSQQQLIVQQDRLLPPLVYPNILLPLQSHRNVIEPV